MINDFANVFNEALNATESCASTSKTDELIFFFDFIVDLLSDFKSGVIISKHL